MFDNLREDAATSSLYEEQAKFQPATGTRADPFMRRPTKFLGMTSFQRFFLAVLLLLAVCTLGSMCLLVTGRIGLF
jgi:hypothetical protein